MAKKPLSMSAPIKNPVSEIFGEILKRIREVYSKTSDKVAELMGIGSSYYRLVESGSTNLHVSKGLGLVHALDGVLDFNGVCNILMAISVMEINANKSVQTAQESKSGITKEDAYYNGIIESIETLSKYDFKLNVLFEKLRIAGCFDFGRTANERIDSGVYFLRDYLTNYEKYGQSTDDTQIDYISEFLNEVPPFYFAFLQSFRDQLLKLPIRINFADLWKWEDENEALFRKMYCVIKNPEFVTGIDNLRKYQYKHLWNPDYECAMFICDSKKPSEKIKAEFVKNLRQSLLEKTVQSIDIGIFDKIMEKVHFKCYDFSSGANKIVSDLLDNILSSSDDTKESATVKNTLPGAVWVHSLTSYPVGFFALTDENKLGLVEGITLKLLEAKEKIKLFDEIWDYLKQ